MLWVGGKETTAMKTKRTKTIEAWAGGFAIALTLAASPAKAQTYRLASHKAINGFEKVQLADGSTVYLGDAVPSGAKPCSTHNKGRDHTCTAAELSLSGSLAARIAMSVQRTGANLIAVSRDNVLIELSEIDAVSLSTITLRNTRQVQQAVDVGTAVVTLSTRSASVTPGDAVTVDVFVSGVDQLRTFQVSVEATGGTSGSLDRVEASVDRERADYVFATIQAIDAADQLHGRVGATTMGGSVNAQDKRYLGTFTFMASRDASGTFGFTVRPLLSFLSDAIAQDLAYRTTANAVQVATGKTTRVTR